MNGNLKKYSLLIALNICLKAKMHHNVQYNTVLFIIFKNS